MIDANYVADHVVRIEEEFADRPTLRRDSLWRIADHAEIFGSELSRYGELKPLEIAEIERWIEEFRASPEGSAAIASIREARANGYRQSPCPEGVSV